jgi:hypothetical protein
VNEAERAESDRLKAENSYLLARLCELEAKLNSNLEVLASALARLSKIIVPANLPRLLTLSRRLGFYRSRRTRSTNGSARSEFRLGGQGVSLALT